MGQISADAAGRGRPALGRPPALGATMGIESDEPEIACTSTAGGLITTGGGFSTHYEQPSYQKAAVAAVECLFAFKM